MTGHTHGYSENNIPQKATVEPGRPGVGLLAASILGGLAGAGAMLLLAPHSGKKTRARLQEQGVKLRNLITEGTEGRSGKARRMKDRTRRQSKEVEQSSQAMLDEGAPPTQ